MRDHEGGGGREAGGGEEEVCGVGSGKARTVHHDPARPGDAAEEPVSAIGKARRDDGDLERPGQHERHEREVEAAQAQRGQAPDDPDRHGAETARDDGEDEGGIEGEVDAQRDPAADADQRVLAERHEAQPAVEQPGPHRGDGDGHGRCERREPEASGEQGHGDRERDDDG